MMDNSNLAFPTLLFKPGYALHWTLANFTITGQDALDNGTVTMQADCIYVLLV